MPGALQLSSNARLRWGADGRLFADGARSTEGIAIEAGDVAFLERFGVAADPEAVIREHARGDGSRLRALVEELHRIGALVPADGGLVGTGHFADPQRQLALLWDSVRMNAFRLALERCAAGKVLVELGTGHGVLACLAARAGARRVYAIEEADIIEVAREIASRNGLEERIVFVEGNSLDVELPEPAQVVFGDLMGADPLGAGMLVYLHDAAARFLEPGGIVLPARLKLLAVGVDSQRITRETDDARTWIRDAKALSAAYGLDLAPLEQASRSAFARSYDAYSYKELLDSAAGGDRILTGEVQVAEFELGRADPARAVETPLSLPVEHDGTLNAIATYAAVELDAETTLTNSPFATERASAWGGQFLSALRPIEVAAGTTAEVEAEVTPWTSPAVRYRQRSGEAASPFGA
jgi:predicted O-methyltransferase YrrM